jgi:type I restriction enzyme S subunit
VTEVERVRVGDVLSLERREVTIDPKVEYRLVGVYSFGKGIFHRDPKAGVELGDYRFFRIEPGDLVLSNIQAWEGAVGFATEVERGTVGTHRFLSYVAASDRIDTNWARWFFLSEPGITLIRRAAPGTAVRNRTLAVKRFEDLVIPLPALDEQRRLAARLDRIRSNADTLACLSSRCNDLSTALGVAHASRPDLSADDKARLGWVRTRLEDVMRRTTDPVTIDPSDEYPNLGIYSFGRGLFAKPPIDGSRTSAKTLFRVRNGQFIYSRLFAFEGAYSFVPQPFDGYFVSNEFPSFDVDPERLNARWLASYLRTPERWAELATTSVGLGVRRQRVPVDALLAYEVWLPPIEIQSKVALSIEVLGTTHAARRASEARVASLLPSALNREFGSLA